jgi:hypothetical protein
MAKNQSESGTVLHAWDHYLKEASRPPFELRVSDEETITITNPTGAQMHRIAEGMRSEDTDVTLMGLCGDQYERVIELLSDAPYEVTTSLTEDLLDHFGFLTDVTLVGPSGRKKTVRKYSELQELLQRGWKPEDLFPTSEPNGS